jgi:hypothetical protein
MEKDRVVEVAVVAAGAEPEAGEAVRLVVEQVLREAR